MVTDKTVCARVLLIFADLLVHAGHDEAKSHMLANLEEISFLLSGARNLPMVRLRNLMCKTGRVVCLRLLVLATSFAAHCNLTVLIYRSLSL